MKKKRIIYSLIMALVGMTFFSSCYAPPEQESIDWEVTGTSIFTAFENYDVKLVGYFILEDKLGKELKVIQLPTSNSPLHPCKRKYVERDTFVYRVDLDLAKEGFESVNLSLVSKGKESASVKNDSLFSKQIPCWLETPYQDEEALYRTVTGQIITLSEDVDLILSIKNWPLYYTIDSQTWNSGTCFSLRLLSYKYWGDYDCE